MKLATNTAESREKAKQIVLAILQASGGTFSGRKRLYKTFVLAHMYYYNRNPGLLSDWPIVHMPMGPGIEDGPAILRELRESGRIKAEGVSNGPFPEEENYTLTGTVGKLSQDELAAVWEAAEYVKGKTGEELSLWFHENSRSYAQGRSGRELNIYIDLADDETYADRQKLWERARRDVEAVFGT